MQLASIESFAWPQEGVQVEMRRHLSGKYRAYMDTEIITALLFQYLGMRWSVGFKSAFRDLVNSPAWKRDAREFTREERLQRGECFEEPKADVPQSIEHQRRTEQSDLFFMTQLPGELASLSPYDESPVVTGPAVVNVQQTLLKIVNTEIYLKQVLHGQCTVIRTDLEWYVNPVRSEINLSLTSIQVRSIIASRFDLDPSSLLRHARALGYIYEEVAECFPLVRSGRPAKDPKKGCSYRPYPSCKQPSNRVPCSPPLMSPNTIRSYAVKQSSSASTSR